MIQPNQVRRIFPFCILIALALCTFVRAQDATLKVVSWNVESGGAQVQTLSRRIREFQGVDLWGLSEVDGAQWATAFTTAAGNGENATFRHVLGTTGGRDRLLIIYNANRFTLLSQQELHEINIENRVRSPLVARLRDTRSNAEFFFMVNHLYRGDEHGRHQQAQLLNDWVRAQTLPVIAVGDYNFDWDVETGDTRHDAGYDLMTREGRFVWLRPATLVRSQCSFDSVLDFVFKGGGAAGWQGTSEIIAQPSDCPDNAQTSDHRPVLATITIGPNTPPQPPQPTTLTRAQLLQRIDALEAQLRELRELIQRLP